MDLETVYSRLPTFGQNLACSLEGLRIKKSRYNSQFLEILAACEERDKWDQRQLEEYRDTSLRKYIRHCAETMPFFGQHFRRLGIPPSEIRGLADLKQLPILSKAEILANAPEVRSGSVSDRECIISHTSGTTGSGLKFHVTQFANWMQWAVTWRYRRWHGINLDTKCAYFAGRSVVPTWQREPPYWRYDLARQHILFSGYHISPATLPAYINELRRQRAPWICGYPSLLSLVATYILESGQDLGYAPRWVTVQSENLLSQQKQLIAQAFGTVPRQHYGMTEGAANISECEMGRLHVDEDFSAVEFITEPGLDSCRVVGTAFHNTATGFLRYEVGDRARLSGQVSCACGRPGRLVETIDGRREDYVIRRDGSKVGRMDHIFKDLIAIREAQIQQSIPGEVNIRVVRAPSYGAVDEERLRSEVMKRLGAETMVNIEYWESLPRGSGGKLRFVVSSLDAGKIGGSD